MKRQNTVTTNLKCSECGFIMPISRRASKQRELGHTKHMYCAGCKQTQAFTELQEIDANVSFWEDWQNKV